MMEPQEPLDLSLLARVSSDSTFKADSEPRLPGNESDGYREVPLSAAGREEPTRPRSAGPSRPRSTGRGSSAAWRGKTRASVESERPPPTKPEPRSVVRDDSQTWHAGMFVKPLTDLYVAFGAAVYPLDQDIGTSFIENAKQCAESLDAAARVDKNLRRFLLSLVGASVWGPIIIAHAPIATRIAMKLVPNFKVAPLPSTNGQPA